MFYEIEENHNTRPTTYTLSITLVPEDISLYVRGNPFPSSKQIDKMAQRAFECLAKEWLCEALEAEAGLYEAWRRKRSEESTVDSQSD